MSECVVRMNMPQNCYNCDLRYECNAFYAPGKPKPFMKGCRIVCQLPEGHGRLIDADALRADYFVTSTTTNTPLYRYVSMEQIANAPTVEPASPWHRVEDELPSMDGYDWVLGIVTGEAGCLRFHKAVMMVSFDPQYKEWFIDEYPDARITVSHWMLLPEPPKEDA